MKRTIAYIIHTPIKFLSAVVIGYSEYGAIIPAVKIDKAKVIQKSILRQVGVLFVSIFVFLTFRLVYYSVVSGFIYKMTLDFFAPCMLGSFASRSRSIFML